MNSPKPCNQVPALKPFLTLTGSCAANCWKWKFYRHRDYSIRCTKVLSQNYCLSLNFHRSYWHLTNFVNSGRYSWAQFMTMVNQGLLTSTTVAIVLDENFDSARQKNIHQHLKSGLDRHKTRSFERKKHRLQLSQTVEPQRLLIQHSPGDGNCFYHSIAAQTGESQSQVRERMYQKGIHLVTHNPNAINIQHGWPPVDELQSNLEQGYIRESAQGAQPNRYWGSSESSATCVCQTYQRPAAVL